MRLGYGSFFERQLSTLTLDSHVSIVRVLAEARGRWLVSDGRDSCAAVLAGRLQHQAVNVCVGDFVVLDDARESGLARIVHVLERTSLFQRKEPGKTSAAQLIAANVDLALVVCALARDDADPHARAHGLNPRRIERYLQAVRAAPARALVVVNKADLSSHAEDNVERLRAELRGVPVLLVSAESGQGLEALGPQLFAGVTAVLVGSSGVGKSSLVNALLGRAAQRVNSVRGRRAGPSHDGARASRAAERRALDRHTRHARIRPARGRARRNGRDRLRGNRRARPELSLPRLQTRA